MKQLLLIDHYDSFTYIIKSYFELLHVSVTVVQHADPILLNIEAINPDFIVFSPGPGHPSAAVRTIDMIKKYHTRYPMLGICLGMQCIAEAFDGRVIHAKDVVHGKQSSIHHTTTRIFSDIPSPCLATRYHSLMVEAESISKEFQVNAWTFDHHGQRIIMGVEHNQYPVFGVQYHPEAILTEYGLLFFKNFLTEALKFKSVTSLANRH